MSNLAYVRGDLCENHWTSFCFVVDLRNELLFGVAKTTSVKLLWSSNLGSMPKERLQLQTRCKVKKYLKIKCLEFELYTGLKFEDDTFT